MHSILERQGLRRLEELASRRELPDMLSLPDVAVVLARECVGPPLPDDAGNASAQFKRMVAEFMNMLTPAALVGDLRCGVTVNTDGQVADQSTPDKPVDVRIIREDFRAWCERQRRELPVCWFTDAEIAEHTAAISKPVAGAAAANARFDEARKFAEQVYLNSLAEEEDSRPGSVAKFIHGVIAEDLLKFGLTSAPTIPTITGWIRPLAPESARRPGRPRK